MSHASLLIISENNNIESLESLMAPYWELDLTREELMESKTAEFVPVMQSGENINTLLKEHNEEHTRLKDDYVYDTIEEWMESWHGYYLNKEGTYWGYYHNPNAKWDWWVVGGRWCGGIKLKDKFQNSGAIGSPSWTYNGKNPYKPNTCDSAQKKRIDSECLRSLLTFAVLDKNGWHEKSELGWFGVSCYNGYCCIGDNIPIRAITEHFKYTPRYTSKAWTGCKNEYVIVFLKVLYEYYELDIKNRQYVLKDKYSDGKINTDEDYSDSAVKIVPFFRDWHWRDIYYKRFIKPIDDEMYLTIVDYHI